jgi:glycosidase
MSRLLPIMLRLTVLSLLCAASYTSMLAQLSADCAAVATQVPCVSKVDPPDWWAGMPAPMLLLYGRNLKDTHISVGGSGVAIAKTHFSENGHYAFLWLSEKGMAPQTVSVRVASNHGEVSFPFELKQPKPASAGFQGFSAKDSMYLIMTDRFADGDTSNDGDHAAEEAKIRGWHGGDLRGILQHLDYLQDLGITTVWMTPVYANEGEPDSYHGYGATDLYKVDPHYGSLGDLQRLGEALHQRHMKLVLDMVPNHVGPKIPWVNDEPEPDWFHGTLEHHDPAQGGFAPLIDPHAAWRDQKDILEGWFANVLPDMNQENPDTSQYLIQNTVWWVEQSGADGIRIDTFPYVGRQFWHDYHAQLKAIFPRLTSVGEIFNPDPVTTSSFAGGVTRSNLNGQVDTGLFTPFDFPSYFALRDVLLKDAPLTVLEKVFGQDALYPHPERLVPFLGNHDTARFMSMPGATAAKMKLGFAILLTMRGMPQIYSGDELAMTGGEDPDNRHDFPGGFPGDKHSAFSDAGRTAEQKQMHDWVAALLHFRNEHPVFAEGGQQDVFAKSTTLAYVRADDVRTGCVAGKPGRVLVAVNNADQDSALQIDTAETALAGCMQFTPALDTEAVALLNGNRLTMTLGPRQAAIFEVH